MPTYSSAQFYKDWRYSLEKDFSNPSGERVKYAQDGLRTWGSEKHRLPFHKAAAGASVNCDGSLIAVGVDRDVFIYDTINFNEVLVCRGHVSKVDALAFQPGNPKVLISSAQMEHGRSFPADEPTIIVWDLDELPTSQTIQLNVIASIASQAADCVRDNLLMTQPHLELSTEEEKSLTSVIEPVIERIVRTRAAANQRSIKGRLCKSFQSEIFSPSGNHLIYMPGSRPQSNNIDRWSVNIYSMATHEDVLTLGGPGGAHTDAVMWTGYSPDETMIATVAWDETMRIWDAQTGREKFTFKTNGQNWTGGFSPDSRRFAGTCGKGVFYVYSLDDGATLVQQEWPAARSSKWMRCLDWSPDSSTVAVGSSGGRFVLYDVERKEFVQERIMSTEACRVPPDYKFFVGGNLECYVVKFVDGGRKVVVLTAGDGGVETYDLQSWEKWRFVRPGVDPPFEDEPEEEVENVGEGTDDGAVGAPQKKRPVDRNFDNPLVHGGYRMTIWEDQSRGIIFFATMDGDAVRIWDLPLTKNES